MGTVSVWDDKNIQKQVMVTVVQHCECTQCQWTVKLKMVKMSNFITIKTLGYYHAGKLVNSSAIQLGYR